MHDQEFPAIPDQEASLDSLCDEFESLWEAGARPEIGDYLARVSAAQQEALFAELLAVEWHLRGRRGDAPSAGKFVEQFPQYQHLVRRVAKLHGQDSTASRLRIDWDTHASQPFSGSAEPAVGSRFGDYQLLQVLGRGGMGLVFKARQVSANRIVALKLVRPDRMAHLSQRQREIHLGRFRNEVQAAAKLEHDHVVPVYDVGASDGLAYYAMRYIDGESLKDKLQRGPLDPQRAARYAEQIAQALAHAHVRGILHRDVKPHNVMIDAQTDRALLTDFGLAKLGDDDQQLTATDVVYGSPPYMSPEQTLDARQIAAASDIYGLGATLYHLLTGRPPFQAASTASTILQVQAKEPVAPRQLNPSVPVDLETICLKCLEKEAGKRYASAANLADELARFGRGEPILARPVSRAEYAWRWCRKNRLITALALSIVALLVVGTAVSAALAVRASYQAQRAEHNAAQWQRQKIRADSLADVAERRRREAEAGLFASLVSHATLLEQERDAPGWTWQAEAALAKANEIRPADADQSRLRSLFVSLWTAHDVRPRATLAGGIEAAAIAFHPDGKQLAIGQQKNNLAVKIIICDVASRQPTRQFILPTLQVGLANLIAGKNRFQEGISALAFSPDGRWLFAGTRSGNLHAWDLHAGGDEPISWNAFGARVLEIAVARDSQRIAARTSRDDEYRCRAFVYRDAAWRETPMAADHAGGVASSARRDLGAVTLDRELRLLRHELTEAGQPIASPLYADEIGFHPSGRIIAGLFEQQVRFFDAELGVQSHVAEVAAPQQGLKNWLSFSRSGEMVAVGGQEQVVHLVETSTGQALAAVATAGRNEPIAAFSPREAHLAIAQHKQTAVYQLRDDATSGFALHVGPTAGRIEDMAVSDDGQLVLTTTRATVHDGVVYILDVWSAATGDLRRRYRYLHAGPAAARPTLVAVENNCGAWVLPGIGCLTIDLDASAASSATGPAASPAVEREFEHETISATPSRPQATPPSPLVDFNVTDFALTEDGRTYVAIVAEDQLVEWDARSLAAGKTWSSSFSATLTGMSELTCIDPSSAHLVVGRRDGLAVVREIGGSQAPDFRRLGTTRIECVSAARAIATFGTSSGELLVCRAPSLEVIQSIAAYDGAVGCVAMSQDGRLIASGSAAGELVLFLRHQGGYETMLRLSLGRPIRGLALDDAGKQLFVVSQDAAAVQRWNLDQLHARLQTLDLAFPAAD